MDSRIPLETGDFRQIQSWRRIGDDHGSAIEEETHTANAATLVPPSDQLTLAATASTPALSSTRLGATLVMDSHAGEKSRPQIVPKQTNSERN